MAETRRIRFVGDSLLPKGLGVRYPGETLEKIMELETFAAPPQPGEHWIVVAGTNNVFKWAFEYEEACNAVMNQWPQVRFTFVVPFDISYALFESDPAFATYTPDSIDPDGHLNTKESTAFKTFLQSLAKRIGLRLFG